MVLNTVSQIQRLIGWETEIRGEMGFYYFTLSAVTKDQKCECVTTLMHSKNEGVSSSMKLQPTFLTWCQTCVCNLCVKIKEEELGVTENENNEVYYHFEDLWADFPSPSGTFSVCAQQFNPLSTPLAALVSTPRMLRPVCAVLSPSQCHELMLLQLFSHLLKLLPFRMPFYTYSGSGGDCPWNLSETTIQATLSSLRKWESGLDHTVPWRFECLHPTLKFNPPLWGTEEVEI